MNRITIKVAEGWGDTFKETCNLLAIECEPVETKRRPHRAEEFTIKYNHPKDLFQLGVKFYYAKNKTE